ncbi:MAG TPA: glycosyltransferase family 4 protein [Longimicrobium sp.]|nr:glycosyltransferase family 4 protein [Longimicrobium sp.]
MSARQRPARILLIGEEHVRDKVARHYDLLAEERGIQTHYFVDDRSGITRELQKQRAMEVHYGPNPAQAKTVPLYWAGFVRTFERVRPDVVEVYTAVHYAVLLPMVLYAKLRGAAVTVVCRGELYPPIFNALSKAARTSLVRILRAADLVIYKELYMEALLAEMCPDTEAVLWTNAIPIRPQEPEYAREGNRVLFLNFFKDWRNPDVLIRAAPLVRARIPDAEFDLVGGTDNLAAAGRFYADLNDYERGLHALIGELGVGDYVRLHPFTSEVDPWFARAKAYVLPADLVFCNYGLLEAMERGVPPVVTDEKDPDARRIVEDGVSGLVTRIDPRAIADAIVELLGDEETRQRMARAARARVAERFDLRRGIHALADRYEALARRGGRARAAARPASEAA